MKTFGCLYLILLTFIVESKYSNETCNCYLLGTISSVESESICNEETLQCKCYPNILGLNCDKCAEGHYDILSSEGCSSCSCDTFGSLGNQCDEVTGQCTCKDGYRGLRCKECDYLKYEYENNCIDCNCNTDGSEDLQCDDKGKCKCHQNVEGDTCSHCATNTYNLKEGCIPCSSCYDLVQDQVNAFKYNLTRSQDSVDNIEKQVPSILEDNENFIQEMQILRDKIQKLKPQLQEPSYEKYQEMFLEFEQKIDKFQGYLQSGIKYIEASTNDNITKLIEELKLSLKENSNLFVQGQEEYKNAQARFKILNNENNTVTGMSQSAHTQLAQIEKVVQDLSDYEVQVTNLTSQACDKAAKFQQTETDIAIELSNLNLEVQETTANVITRKKYITEFNYQTKETHRETLVLSQQADESVIPSIEDTSDDSITLNYTNFIVNGIISEVSETTDEFKEEMVSTDRYLEKVHLKQISTNEYFRSSETYEIRADSAIQLVDDLFSTGQNDLESFKQYGLLQQAIKDLLKDIPGIQAKVDAVKNHSTEAKHIFEEVIDVIKANEDNKVRLDGIFKFIDGHQTNLMLHEKLVKEIEEEENDISVELEKYHAQLKDIRYNVDKVNKLEEGAKSKLKEAEGYLTVLNSIPLNEEQLETAQQEIETMESMYDTIDELTAIKEILKNEIANIKEILESLPIDDQTLCEAPESEPKLGSR